MDRQQEKINELQLRVRQLEDRLAYLQGLVFPWYKRRNDHWFVLLGILVILVWRMVVA